MSNRSVISNWLQLLRAPNLFTVPGDPLAGFVLAAAGGLSPKVLWAVGAALCFYGAGLLTNDVKDLQEDLKDRPRRPIASGAVSKTAATLVAIGLMLMGLVLSAAGGLPALWVAGVLSALVLLYNLWAKSLVIFGPLVMGCCRGASLSFGAAFANGTAVFPALLLVAYIAAVTHLARLETIENRPHLQKWFPAIVLGCGTPFFLSSFTGLALWGLAAVLAVASAAKIEKVTPATIGFLIRLLLPIQAAFCAKAGGVGVCLALLLLALWPISRIVGRRFYAS